MKRYIVKITRVTTGSVTTYSYVEKEPAEKKMAKLDSDPRYTYEYSEK